MFNSLAAEMVKIFIFNLMSH